MAWFVSSVVDFLPDLKGRGIRLAPPVNHVLNLSYRADPLPFDIEEERDFLSDD